MSAISRVAVVTGAARGIGRAISLRLAQDGVNVVASDLHSKREELQSLASEIESTGKTKAMFHLADVSQESDVQELVSSAATKFGGVDIMIANAGICLTNPLVSLSVNEWEKTFSINVRGVFLCYKAAAMQMIKQKRGGRIIGASSTAGKRGIADVPAYSASKFAVRGLTQAVSEELWKHNITVNAYAPGQVNTPMLQGSLADHKGKGMEMPILQNSPIMQPENIASLVAYLVRDDARYITGQTICVNAGMFYD